MNYEKYRADVDSNKHKKWKLDVPYFKWEQGRIISCDNSIDPETKTISPIGVLISKTWNSFGDTVDDASTALKNEIINPILNNNSDMTLVVLQEYMEPFYVKNEDGGIVNCGFCAGFAGGFAKNPTNKTLI